MSRAWSPLTLSWGVGICSVAVALLVLCNPLIAEDPASVPSVASRVRTDLARASATKNRVLDSVWEVNARALPAETTLDPIPRMRFFHAMNGGWHRSDASTFVGHCDMSRHLPSRKTIVYVHGNWTSQEHARERGMAIYRRLTAITDAPLHFIIYSWASDRASGPAKDLKRKRERLNGESYYLSQVLRFIPDSSPLSMLGFSFGTGVSCGFLELEAGGELGGVRLVSKRNRSEVNVMFLAAAFDRADLGRGGLYEHALDRVKRVVNLYNSVDPALKRFRFLDIKSDPVAAGYVGIPPARTASNTRYFQFDCTQSVGRSHSEMAYLQQCHAFDKMLPTLLGMR